MIIYIYLFKTIYNTVTVSMYGFYFCNIYYYEKNYYLKKN